jgi:poly-gamma-glutamate capsule biosynthesis protein CapA/YwtB (metallophosphatase superfamily)
MSKNAYKKFAAEGAGFEAKTVDVTVASGRTFSLRELNARQQRMVDDVSKTSEIETMYKRIAASIEAINGRKLPEVTEASDYDSILELLSGTEIDQLSRAYIENFIPSAAELKNSSTAT